MRRSPTQPLAVGPAPIDLRPGTMVGEYQVVAKLAQGGMGTVYAGVHPVIAKRVAIKVIRRELGGVPEAAERFVQEARAVNQIGHPNIVDIFAMGQLDDGRQYLVMERLEGETLADRLDRGRMPAHEAIETLVQICGALSAAHDHDVIHRDLKPDNVYLATGGESVRAVLLDFGIAKLVSGPALVSGSTTPGMMVGTPEYMSPEQARGELVDPSTDVYSLGAIAYEMFLEGAPFFGPSPMDVIAAMLSKPPELPSVVWPDIPPQLETLLMAMLSKRRELRPSIAEVVAALCDVREQLTERVNLGSGIAGVVRERSDSFATGRIGMTSGPIPLLTTTAMSTGVAPRSRRPKWIAAAFAVVAVIAVVSIVVLSRRDGSGTAASAKVGEASAAPQALNVGDPTAGSSLPPAPATGFVDLSVNADEPHVIIDGVNVIIPSDGGPLELAACDHEIRVAADGYLAETQTIEVAGGSHAVLEIELEPSAPNRTIPKRSKPEKKRGAKKRDAKKRDAKKRDAEKRDAEKRDAEKRENNNQRKQFDVDGTLDPFSPK